MNGAILYGQALAHLRLRARLSQVQAAMAAGTSQPTWGRYESGDSLAFYERLTIRNRILEALGFTARDLDTELALLQGGAAFAVGSDPADVSDGGVFESGAAMQNEIARLRGDGVRFIRIVTDDLAPYVAAGGYALYNVKGYPRRHQGAIVKLRDGGYVPRLFVRQGSGFVEVLRYEACDVGGRAGFIEVVEKLPIEAVEGVYPIIARGDHAQSE